MHSVRLVNTKNVGCSVLLLVIALLSGCGPSGPKTYPVSGTVTFDDGTPVKFGSVEFYHEGADVSARGTIQADGTFTMGTFKDGDGAIEGTHRVIVVQILMGPSGLGVGNSGGHQHASHDHAEGANSSGHLDHGRHVSPEFGDYGTSGLECVVKATDANRVELVLKTER